MDLRVTALSAWVPGVTEKNDLLLWARGEKDVQFADDKKSLPNHSFIPALQRRRMTPLSKLVAALIHSVQDKIHPDAKIYFISLAGESERQFQVNSMVLQDGEVLPATFSTSVFNTPPAMASIVLGLKNGYSALYPPSQGFFSAVQCVFSSILGGNNSQVLMVYGDAQAPEEYQALEGACSETWGFAALLECGQDSSMGSINAQDFTDYSIKRPQDFLLKLYERNESLLNLVNE